MSGPSLLLFFKNGGSASKTVVRRGLRHAPRQPRTIARQRRLGQLLQTPEWIGDGLKFDDDNRLDFDLDTVFPVVDTTNIVKDPDDATKTMRIDVGAVTSGQNRALVMPDFDVDFSALIVGAGITSPDGTLHVHTASAGAATANANADDLIVENSGHCGISIITPNDKIGSLYFADPDDGDANFISYNHSTDTLQLAAGASVALELTSSLMTAKADFVLTKYTNAARPSAGTAGRVIFNTDDGQLNIDNGSAWTLPDGTTT